MSIVKMLKHTSFTLQLYAYIWLQIFQVFYATI